MSIRHLIILSQLNPPAPNVRILHRDRIETRLDQAFNYPLTILHAGTGYGKSTAVISFLQTQESPIYWFTTSGTDRDPKLFLAKLFTAFNQLGKPLGDEALRILDMPDATYQEALIALLNQISRNIKSHTLFFLDDFHQVSDVDEIIGFIDWMIERLPPELHIIISSRYYPSFPSINKWVIKGKVLEIDKSDLMFTEKEIRQLFEGLYGIVLPDESVSLLQKKTEGWAIGLQVVWKTLQNQPNIRIARIFDESQQSKTALFEYLADEILSGLDPKIQNFLIQTSILSKLDSSTCDFLLNIDNSDKLLTQIQNAGLFIEELRPGLWRYHELFREFLNNHLQRSEISVKDLHLKIASYFRAHEYWEEAIFHLLMASEFRQVNQILENIGEKLINDGRHESINYWICEIPESIRKEFPYLAFLLGEVNRYLEKFDDALEYYHMAERLYRQNNNKPGISMALKGQAQVFLDTIRPINADQLLQDALKLLDPKEMGTEVSDLLVLIAENQLNLGFPDRAQAFLAEAKQFRSEFDRETDLIQARILLRSGCLQEGIDLLNAREANNPRLPISRPQRFHRESTLLLSLFYAIIGEIDKAEQFAKQGIEIGKILQSKFVQSVGFMRLGHAILLRSQQPFTQDGFELAMEHFQTSIENVDVVRIHVEPLWGMCRALGYTGQIEKAEDLALKSLAIAEKAGDEWIGILIRLSLGAGAVLGEKFDAAQEYLTTAEVTAQKVKDPFTLCIARMWLAVKAWKQGYSNTAFGYLEKILPILESKNYGFLFERETLLGFKDPEMIYPLLLAAHENGIGGKYIESLLKTRNLTKNSYHPGYTIWIRTLGGFRVWRGDQVIDQQSWKREKARELLELLVLNRERWLHRDQINAILWADTPVENAANYLKVVFNSLNQVLEPNRPRGAQTFFVERQQERYRLNPKARIIIDTDQFVEAIKSETLSALEYALNLYQGKYFADCFIQEWCAIEEQYYHQQYLLASEKLISILLDQKALDKALDITYQVLNKDNLWEPAYRSQMKIFHEMGEYAMIHKVFRQCQEVFKQQLDSLVSPSTLALYEKITSGFEISH